MTLIFLAALGTVVVSFVLYPVLSREVAPAEKRSSSDDTAPELERLAEAKQRLLESVKEVEFEYRAGKLSEADYQRVRADDLAQVAQIMARIDKMTKMTEMIEMGGTKKTVPESDGTAPESEAATSEDSETTCKSCQQGNPSEARFCLRCGKPISHTLECSKCGTELPAEAQFCIRCGTAVQT